MATRSFRGCCFLALLFTCVLVPVQVLYADSAGAAAKYWERQVASYQRTVAAARQHPEKVTVHMLFRGLNAFLAEMNKEDHVTNMGIAEQLAEKAMKTNDKNEESAKKYMRAARAYRQYALANKRIWDGYEKENMNEIRAGVQEVLEAEKLIERETGKRPLRRWLTENELARYMQQRQKAKRK